MPSINSPSVPFLRQVIGLLEHYRVHHSGGIKEMTGHLEPPTKDTSIDDGPPFLEGILTIISFDGLMHAWYSDYSIALHKSSGQWYCWGTVEQMATIAEWCIEETPCLTTVDASRSQYSDDPISSTARL